MCQSPSHRGTHFYAPDTLFVAWSYMCQSPSHRGTHFYTAMSDDYCKVIIVSIPFTSGNSFLHSGNQRQPLRLACVNPLHIGELISTRKEVISMKETVIMCQSPSHRGTHFYGWRQKNESNGSIVSIPFTSGNSFLRIFTKGRKDMTKLCQSPSRRGTHFYFC